MDQGEQITDAEMIKAITAAQATYQAAATRALDFLERAAAQEKAGHPDSRVNACTLQSIAWSMVAADASRAFRAMVKAFNDGQRTVL